MNGFASLVMKRYTAGPVAPKLDATAPGCRAFDVTFFAASLRADSRANQMLHSFDAPYTGPEPRHFCIVARSSHAKRAKRCPADDTVRMRAGALAASTSRSSYVSKNAAR